MKKTVLPKKIYVWFEYSDEGPYCCATEYFSDIPTDIAGEQVGVYLKDSQGKFTVDKSLK